MPPIVAAKTRIQRYLYRDINKIWQCYTGKNLTTFNKNHGTTEEASRNKVLAAKYMALLQLLYTASGNQVKLDTRNEFKSY